MKKYLFLFTFSPVQQFIEQSRKTVDLYAASRILSHLSGTAISAAKSFRNESIKIVFPVAEDNLADASLPNRFIAIVEAEKEELTTLGQQVSDAFNAELRNMASEIMVEIAPKKCIEQIEHFFSVNWIFYPFENDEYHISFSQIERMLGAIKATRAFEQLTETGRKCSVCGERNVKFYRKLDNEVDSRIISKKLFSPNIHITGSKDFKSIDQRRLQCGEGLCAVCFLKRSADKYFKKSEFDERFPSVSRIALMDAIAHLPSELEDRINRIETQLIFDLNNGRNKEILLENNTQSDIDNGKLVLDYLKSNGINFTPYYAVLAFDGDSMGKWLSGKLLKNNAFLNLKQFHLALSQKLGEYAIWVRRFFENKPYAGRDIYAGGDDFLGFLNLQSLFPVLSSLKSKFNEISLDEFTEHKLTFSAGVVIAHYKTPLSIVLRKAREMEKRAKSIDEEKDAIAISVMKRSGELLEGVFKWSFSVPTEMLSTQILSEIVKALRENEFSDTLIRSIDCEFRLLMDKDKTFNNPLLLQSEILRLLKRPNQANSSRYQESDKHCENRKERIEWLNTQLMDIYYNSNTFDNFLSILHIIDFMSRKAYRDD